jgi:hypothetical protein
VVHGAFVSVASVRRHAVYLDAVIYQVTLTCGCRFWEHRQGTEAPPEIGRVERCFATHVTSPDLTLDPFADGVL